MASTHCPADIMLLVCLMCNAYPIIEPARAPIKNAVTMPHFHFLKEKKLSLTINEQVESKPIPGAMNNKPVASRIERRDVTALEYAKLGIEYYLLVYHLPRFRALDHRPVCSMSKVVDMLAAHEDILEVINKKY